ncbi:MAG: class I SAM-dependent methyltransferase [Dermatophilaceae bacterium]
MTFSSRDDLRCWNAATTTYVEFAGTGNDSFWRRFEPFLGRWTPARPCRVLDAGCGPGWLTDHLDRRGHEVVGVDGSAALVEHTRTRRPDVRFEVFDLTRGLPTDVGTSFDLVVSHMVLMDLPEIATLLGDVSTVIGTTTDLSRGM